MKIKSKMMVAPLKALIISIMLLGSCAVWSSEDPAKLIDSTVRNLFDEFTASRDQLEKNKPDLFALVDRVASPLFDFSYISKLVLAKSWKSASENQREEFADEFKKLMIVTYATALFQYTGKETMAIGVTETREKQGVQFAKVHTEVTINEGPPVPVIYDLILSDQGWKVYNLTVADLNMVINYRNVIQSSIQSEGLDGMILTMKENNQKNYK